MANHEGNTYSHTQQSGIYRPTASTRKLNLVVVRKGPVCYWAYQSKLKYNPRHLPVPIQKFEFGTQLGPDGNPSHIVLLHITCGVYTWY